MQRGRNLTRATSPRGPSVHCSPCTPQLGCRVSAVRELWSRARPHMGGICHVSPQPSPPTHARIYSPRRALACEGGTHSGITRERAFATRGHDKMQHIVSRFVGSHTFRIEFSRKQIHSAGLAHSMLDQAAVGMAGGMCIGWRRARNENGYGYGCVYDISILILIQLQIDIGLGRQS